MSSVGQQSTGDAQLRPVYHFAAPRGWINDPNGFSVYDGKIHLFYQWNPDEPIWGNMHWGHSVSDDFLTWEELPAALAPEDAFDIRGCFSGSAAEQDGRHVLLYTGVSGELAPSGEYVQQQCLATGDGRTYTKYEGNPVIPASALPEGYDTAQFRDPLVFRDGDDYVLVAAALDGNGFGRPLLFRSPDLMTWTLEGAIDGEGGRYGGVIECPDLFALNGKHVLKVSAIHGHDVFGDDYPEASGDIAEIGSFDGKEFHFENRQPMDEGRDYYAAQSMKTPDGRRIIIAWMQAGHNVIRPESIKWQGMMTIPRVLRIEDGWLVQAPVRELDTARTDKKEIQALSVSHKTPLVDISGRSLDLLVQAKSPDGSMLTISLAEKGDSAITLVWDPKKGTLAFDRTNAGLPSAVDEDRFAVQTVHLTDPGDTIDLRILLDAYSVEVFINGGRQVFTAQYYAPADAEGISLSSDGTVTADVEAYTIAPDTAAKSRRG